jgi:hypothetical protein
MLDVSNNRIKTLHLDGRAVGCVLHADMLLHTTEQVRQIDDKRHLHRINSLRTTVEDLKRRQVRPALLICHDSISIKIRSVKISKNI